MRLVLLISRGYMLLEMCRVKTGWVKMMLLLLMLVVWMRISDGVVSGK